MYHVPKAKLDELNALINVGGTIPGEVSNALAALQPFVKPEGKTYFDAAVNANKLNTPAWENVQKWHDGVEKTGDKPDQGGPDNGGGDTGGGTKPAGAPMDPIPADGVTYEFAGFPINTKVTSHAAGDGRFSAAVTSGNVQWKVWVNGALTIDGGMDYSKVKAGDTIEWMQTSQEYCDKCMYTLSLP